MSDAQKNWHYFAYGSNLLTARLLARTPSAKAITSAYLEGHELRFHKVGDDGSGKCDAFFTNNPTHGLWGVIYQLAWPEKAILDAIEGVGQGYELKKISLHHRNQAWQAWTYVVQDDYINADILPFGWYRAFVLEGAREHEFPAPYLAKIAATPWKKDSLATRRNANYALLSDS